MLPEPSGGERPRTEVRLAVVRGSAGFHAPSRFKKIEPLATWTEIDWDSKSGQLTAPKSIDKEDNETIRSPLIEGGQGQAIQKALSDAASKLTDRAGIRILLEGRLAGPETRETILAVSERLVGLGVYPFVVPFVPISGTPLEDHPAPDAAFMRSVLEPLGALLAKGGLRSADIKAGCGKCGACSSLATFEAA